MNSRMIIDTRALFSEITESLLSLLHSFNREDWNASTCYPDWTVKDIVTHLFQTGTSRLSRQRDCYPSDEKPKPIDFTKLSNLIGQSNNEWTTLLQSISPQLLIEFIEISENQLSDFITSQDLDTESFYPVAWAGETQSPNWLDIAREYTERWHHQQQIREAVKAPSISIPKYLGPVIKTLMLSIPFWYKDIKEPFGTRLGIEITGDSGGMWIIEKIQNGWKFIEGTGISFDEKVSLNDDTAWRLLMRSIPKNKCRDRISFSSDNRLCTNFLEVKAIMMSD